MRRRFLALAIFATSALFAAESKPANPDYELRGFFGKDAGTEISLRPVGTENSRWYRLGEKFDGILVEKADAKTGTATIVVNGERRTLRIAGEGATKSEKEKDAQFLRHGRILEKYLAQWEPQMKRSRGESQDQAGITLLKSHPEYFTEEGSRSPEAKAAILRIMKESIMAGMSVPKKDGTLLAPPENLDAAINGVYGDISINLNPSVSEGESEVAGIWRIIVEINRHPYRSFYSSRRGISSKEPLAAAAFENINENFIPRHLNTLELTIRHTVDLESKK